MPATFQKTLGALDLERRQRRRVLLVILIVGVLLGAWVAWFVFGRVPVYALSLDARIQASDQVHPVDVYTSGQVVSVNLQVGRRVHQGEVLLELDATDVRLEFDDVRVRKQGLHAQIQALEVEIAAREQAIDETENAGQASASEALALRRESESRAELAVQEDERAEKLHRAGVVAEAERARAHSSAEQHQAEAMARSRRLQLLQTNTRRDLADRRADKATLVRSLAALRAELDGASVAEAKLREELERHMVRAPVTGDLGQVQTPRVGSTVEKGQTVAVITPEGTLEIIADYAPSDAVGRIRVGQPARMRAHGFPWTQYGTLNARVTAVSGEAQDRLIEVRLQVLDAENSAIPVRHGITGTVEIELEEVSPATLVMRAAGGFSSPSQERD